MGAHNGEEGAQAEGQGDAQVLGLSSGDGLQTEALCVRRLRTINPEAWTCDMS